MGIKFCSLMNSIQDSNSCEIPFHLECFYLKSTLLWDMTPHSLIDKRQCFRETCCLQLQGRRVIPHFILPEDGGRTLLRNVVPIYWDTKYPIPEGSNLHIHWHKNLKYQMPLLVCVIMYCMGRCNKNNETWVTCIPWRSSFVLWRWNSVCYWAVIFTCYVCLYHGHQLSILIQDKDPGNHLTWERGKFHSVGPMQHPLYSSSLLLSQTWAHQCEWCIDLPRVAGNRGQHDDLQNYNMLQQKT